jgi:hypothetical protein
MTVLKNFEDISLDQAKPGQCADLIRDVTSPSVKGTNNCLAHSPTCFYNRLLTKTFKDSLKLPHEANGVWPFSLLESE